MKQKEMIEIFETWNSGFMISFFIMGIISCIIIPFVTYQQTPELTIEDYKNVIRFVGWGYVIVSTVVLIILNSILLIYFITKNDIKKGGRKKK